MVMRKGFLACMVLGVWWLAGCAMVQSPDGQFSTEPVPLMEPQVFQCSVAKETFKGFKPELGNLELMFYRARVTDHGAYWEADVDGKQVTSPQLFKDMLGKLDGSLDPNTGARFYRLHFTNTNPPYYSFSTVNPKTGDGTGMTLFRCMQVVEK